MALVTANADTVTSNRCGLPSSCRYRRAARGSGVSAPAGCNATIPPATAAPMPPRRLSRLPPDTTAPPASRRTIACSSPARSSGTARTSPARSAISPSRLRAHERRHYRLQGFATANQPGSSTVTATISNSTTASNAGFFSTCPPASIVLTAVGQTGNPINVGLNNPQPLFATVFDGNIDATHPNGHQITGISLEYNSTTPQTIAASSGTVLPSFPGSANITALCHPAPAIHRRSASSASSATASR